MHHDWSDKNFDWKGFNKAEEDLTRLCRIFGRLGGQSKEKFGTLRFYAQFGLSLHSLLLPGYYNYGWMPNWLVKFDQRLFSPICNKLLISDIWVKWQYFVYKHAYRYILAKYPHLREEIASGADMSEVFAYFIGTEIVEEDGRKEKLLRHYYKDGSLLCVWRRHL